MLQYQYRLPFSLNACAGFRAPEVLVFGKMGAAAAAAAAVATVKPLGPGRGTAQPEFRAPKADRPERI